MPIGLEVREKTFFGSRQNLPVTGIALTYILFVKTASGYYVYHWTVKKSLILLSNRPTVVLLSPCRRDFFLGVNYGDIILIRSLAPLFLSARVSVFSVPSQSAAPAAQ